MQTRLKRVIDLAGAVGREEQQSLKILDGAEENFISQLGEIYWISQDTYLIQDYSAKDLGFGAVRGTHRLHR